MKMQTFGTWFMICALLAMTLAVIRYAERNRTNSELPTFRAESRISVDRW